jgi:CheY-like chemotaxis protein
MYRLVGGGTIACPASLRHREAHASRTVAWRVMGPDLEIAEANHVRRRIEDIDWRQRSFEFQATDPRLLHGALVEKQIVLVQVHRHVERGLRRGNARHMIDVRMCQQNLREGDLLCLGVVEQTLHFITGIDQHAVSGPRAGHHESVLHERPGGLRLDYDHAVILAILDDLMFSSKIKTTAKQLGTTVTFARSSDGALADMRAKRPALVILDLNNPRTNPLAIVAAMKADPALAAIPIVGYASHVQVDVINAARNAGVDQVLARSGFVEHLPEILSRSQTT